MLKTVSNPMDERVREVREGVLRSHCRRLLKQLERGSGAPMPVALNVMLSELAAQIARSAGHQVAGAALIREAERLLADRTRREAVPPGPPAAA